MKTLLDTITKVGQVLLQSNAHFAASPGLDGDSSSHPLFAGEDDFIVFDDHERDQWCARLDLDRTPKDPNTLPDLVSSVLGDPTRVHTNGVRNWEVNGVLVVADNDGVEFFLDYDKVPHRG